MCRMNSGGMRKVAIARNCWRPGLTTRAADEWRAKCPRLIWSLLPDGGSWGRWCFRVQTASGRAFDLHYDRAPKDSSDRKGHWYLWRELDRG